MIIYLFFQMNIIQIPDITYNKVNNVGNLIIIFNKILLNCNFIFLCYH